MWKTADIASELGQKDGVRQSGPPTDAAHTAAVCTERPLRPFIKWAGGKTRLLRRLLPHAPNDFCRYHEPFVGGGAMFFALRPRIASGAYLSDLNPDLINAWRTLRDDAQALYQALNRFKALDSKQYYYEQRQRDPVDSIERAARFFYLNQTAWNGLWRVNRRGQFNVPWGQRAFRGFSSSQLGRYSAALQDAEIEILDFRDALSRPEAGDFVYLDPPYLPLSDTSKFYFYTEQRFRESDLRDLATCCDELSQRGITWVLSNRDTPLVRDLFKGAKILSLTTRRSVAAQNSRDVEAANSPEVIIVGRS